MSQSLRTKFYVGRKLNLSTFNQAGTVCLMYATISGGKVRWPWYFLLAQHACTPVRPSLYADMNHADRFANLIKCHDPEHGLSFSFASPRLPRILSDFCFRPGLVTDSWPQISLWSSVYLRLPVITCLDEYLPSFTLHRTSSPSITLPTYWWSHSPFDTRSRLPFLHRPSRLGPLPI